jgi:hypothetical protein
MAPLNRQQRRTASIFLRQARRRKATPRETEALIEAGLVEASLLNPRGGDRDSIGSLQERGHYGSASRRLNRGAAADRFLREARALTRRGFKGSSGSLAQAVQRSAFPDRYEQRDAEAESIIRSVGGGRQTRSRGSSALRGAVSERVSGPDLITPPEPVQQQAPSVTPIISAQLAGVNLGPENPVTPPAPPPASPPQQQIELAGPEQEAETPSRRPTAPRRRRPRGGVNRQIVGFSKLAHGQGLKTTSGKRATQGTASGGVSDHYIGNKAATARDWSGSPDAMRATARKIARQLGVKYKPGVTNVVRNGVRYQLIHETNVGGTHFDHVHLGLKKVR